MRFFLPVRPVGKGRPRFGKGRARTPEKTKLAEKAVALLAAPHAPREPWTGAVALSLRFVMPVPKREPGLKGKPHIRKPDLDNLCKTVMDAMKGFWVDDKQVTELSLQKRYQHGGEEPGIWVSVAPTESP